MDAARRHVGAVVDRAAPVGPPEAPEIGAEIWVAPESIEPEPPGARAAR